MLNKQNKNKTNLCKSMYHDLIYSRLLSFFVSFGVKCYRVFLKVLQREKVQVEKNKFGASMM